MRPHMTWKTAGAALLRWLWLVPALALAAGYGGYWVAKREHTTYKATVLVRYQPFSEIQDAHGQPSLKPQHVKPDALASPTYFGALPPHFTLSPVSSSAANLSYTGRPRKVVQAAVSRQASTLVKRWKTKLATYRAASLKKLQKAQANPNLFAYQRAALHRASVKLSDAADRIVISAGDPTTSVANKALSRRTTAVSAAVAGGALAVLLILTGYALRGRIWDRDELAPLGAEVIPIDSKGGPSIHALRLQLEAMSLGRELRSVTITSSARREGHTPVAYCLADAFAQCGTPAVLISADVGVEKNAAGPGLISFLNGSTKTLPALPLGENLRWVPEGGGQFDRAQLMTGRRVDQLIAEAAREGHLVVVEAPPITDDPTALLLASATDVTVLVTHRRKSAAGPIAAAVASLRRVAQWTPLVCFDLARTTDPAKSSAAVRDAAARGAQRPVAPATQATQAPT